MSAAVEGAVPAPTAVAPAADVSISKVESAADWKAFIQFQYDANRHEPAFVPPLWMERETVLDRKKNPWFKFGTLEAFLARRQGKVVGRIAAIEDPRYNDFHQARSGFFGFFECVDDAGVARALLQTVEDWCRARGLRDVLGPMSPSTNNEWAMLIEGFDKPPALLMPYNPRFYPQLLERSGYVKAKDLLAWDLSLASGVPDKVKRVADKVKTREGITLRSAKLSDWNAEVARIREIYNAAWEKNWGFVPMTDAEFDQLGQDLKLIMKPELFLFAEIKGEPVAFCITVPDANEAIRAADGRLFPFGLLKLLWALRSVKRGRLIALGIKREHRKKGLDSILMIETFLRGQKLGWTGGEISWTLEDNDMVNRAIEVFGATVYKKYRCYQRAL